MRKIGSNQYRNRHKYPFGLSAGSWISVLYLLIFIVFVVLWQVTHRPRIISPLSDSPVFVIYERPLTLDELVDKYTNKYTHTPSQRSIMKAKLHFLLSKESKHGNSTAHGDSGEAGGPLQFWNLTYIGYRRIMISRGLVAEIGSRYDLEDAIHTTAWAISDGRENAWGPISRGEVQL